MSLATIWQQDCGDIGVIQWPGMSDLTSRRDGRVPILPRHPVRFAGRRYGPSVRRTLLQPGYGDRADPQRSAHYLSFPTRLACPFSPSFPPLSARRQPE
jgi:hypothetical protein